MCMETKTVCIMQVGKGRTVVEGLRISPLQAKCVRQVMGHAKCASVWIGEMQEGAVRLGGCDNLAHPFPSLLRVKVLSRHSFLSLYSGGCASFERKVIERVGLRWIEKLVWVPRALRACMAGMAHHVGSRRRAESP